MTGRPAAGVRPGRRDFAATPEAVLRQLPELAGHELGVQPLDGGLTNRNFRVTTNLGPEYVARFSDRKSALLGVDRQAEHDNARIAASVGVGPEVVAFAPDDDLLVVRWLPGRALTDADLDDPVLLERVAGLCRRLHAAPPFTGDFDVFRLQRRYLDVVRSRGFRLPTGYGEYEPQVADIERALRASAAPAVPCHNDLLAANIMDDGARLWFIDFEYAGNNDACFELGNIWSEAALAPDRLEHLVTGYYGRSAPVQTARAWLFGLIAKYTWTLWASIQTGVSDVDFDFWSWGMAKYDRAVRDFRGAELHRTLSVVRESIQPEGAEKWPTPSR